MCVNNGLETDTLADNLNELTTVGNVMYATLFNRGVFRSTDNAQSWMAVNNGLTSLRTLSFGARGSTLFVGTENAGVFRSTNEGQNWMAVNNGLPAGQITALASSGPNLLAAVYGQAIYRSTDNGDTWVKSANGFTHPFVTKLRATGNIVNAAGNNGLGVLRSTDGGQTWGFVNAGFNAGYAYDFFVSGSTLYAANSNGILISNMLVNPLANVSAASFAPSAITEKSIVAMYGVNLATNVASAGTVPLPTTLLGTSVKIRDSNGVERLAPLFFVSGGQVNYQIPSARLPAPRLSVR